MENKEDPEVVKSFTLNINNKDSEGSFVNANGFKIFCRYWSSELSSPRALVYMCHGAGEHVGPYTQLAELLTAQNFYVFGHDHQGHGQSEGIRMHIDDFRHYSRDVLAHIDRVKNDFTSLPVYILGHSMGGAVAIISALDRPTFYKGLVFIAPVVIPDPQQIGRCQEFLGTMISYVFPEFPVFKLDPNEISRDADVVEEYKNDRLTYHGCLKAKWAVSLNAARKEIESKLTTIQWPFLTIHGSNDTIVKPEASQALHAKASSTDKTMTIYPGAYHQVHREIEPDGSRARKEIVDWLVSHEQ